MAQDTSFSLTDTDMTLIASLVGKGRYVSASDVLRAGLWLLEKQENIVQALEDALIEGEQSGDALPFDMDAFIAAKLKEGASA